MELVSYSAGSEEICSKFMDDTIEALQVGDLKEIYLIVVTMMMIIIMIIMMHF
jgi:hypothetical protein